MDKSSATDLGDRKATTPLSHSEHPTAPWFTQRVLTLVLAWCWSIIGAAVGLNALVKSSNQKKRIAAAIPPPTVISINIQDILVPGAITTAVCLIIVIFTTVFLSMTILRPRSFKRTYVFQAILLMICAVWLLIVLIVETIHFSLRSARVTATLDGFNVPQSLIQTVQKSLGITGVYKHISYLRIAVILPWFAFLFTLLCSITLFIAASRILKRPRNKEAQ